MKATYKKIIKIICLTLGIILISYLGFTAYSIYVFSSISQSHIDGNVPDEKEFDSLLVRDIKKYFHLSNDGIVSYELLRNGPT